MTVADAGSNPPIPTRAEMPAGRPQPKLGDYGRGATMVGIVCLAVMCIGLITNAPQFFRAYLAGYLLWLGVSLGCMAIVMLHHMTGGNWGMLIRRIGEAAMSRFPIMALLFIPILLGRHALFPWTHGDWVMHDDILKNKSLYLNTWFFTGRAIVYFAVWIIFAGNLRRWSLLQDGGKNPETTGKMQAISAPGLLLFFLTVTFVSVDWIMSRDPHWYSTVQGFLVSVGMALSGIAFLVLMLNLVVRHQVFIKQPQGPDLVTSDELPLADFTTQARLNDLGNLLMVLVILWAYMALSQLIVIWMGNTREDIPWYTERGLDTMRPNMWRWYGLALVILHFFIPFFLLLSRFNKRRLWILGAIATGVMIMRQFDMVWLTAPVVIDPNVLDKAVGGWASWMDVLAPLAIGGIWFGGFVKALEARPVIPPYDPQTDELLIPDQYLAHSGGQGEAGVHTLHENSRTQGSSAGGPFGVEGTAHA